MCYSAGWVLRIDLEAQSITEVLHQVLPCVFLVALGLRFFLKLSLVVVHGLLIAVSSPVTERRL